MAFYLCNTFSLNMLPDGDHARLSVDRIDVSSPRPDIGEYLTERNITSFVGHQGACAILSEKLGMPVPYQRAALKVKYGDSIYVGQVAIRLEEGKVLSAEEMRDVPLLFFVVTVMESRGLHEKEYHA